MQDEIDLKKVESLASRGLTYEQIAISLGFDVRTLYNKRKKNAEISEAIKRGRQKGISLVANKLFEQAASGNTTAMIFFLKAQGGWKEINKQEISGSVNVASTVKADGILGWYDLAEKKCP